MQIEIAAVFFFLFTNIQTFFPTTQIKRQLRCDVLYCLIKGISNKKFGRADGAIPWVKTLFMLHALQQDGRGTATTR